MLDKLDALSKSRLLFCDPPLVFFEFLYLVMKAKQVLDKVFEVLVAFPFSPQVI